MIIDRYSIHDLGGFIAGIQTASKGLFRLTIEAEDGVEQPLCSGWLITDSLLVVPGYAVSDRWTSRVKRYLCSSVVGPVKPTPVEVIHQPSDGTDPALLRLAKPLAGRALKVRVSTVEQGEQVFLLHHPQGQPEQKLSIGRLVGQEGVWLRYDADTENGSGGAPILTSEWAVVGMHVKSDPANLADLRFNEGSSIGAILAALRETLAWSEIAAFHALADVAVQRQEGEAIATLASDDQPDDALLGYAARWSFPTSRLPAAVRDRLRALVVDPSAKRWVLRGDERERLVRSTSLSRLQLARGKAGSDDPGQAVIDRILAGPPYQLDEIAEELLPYWLQAVRWFANVAPDLPSPGDIHRTLERRRLRSRLDAIAGPNFRGRAGELKTLRKWHADPSAGPMVITGIGGVGKSALVGKFASGLPAETILLWLDFDRADLAPDDPVSVLLILYGQLALQVDGFSIPSLDEKSWPASFAKLGGRALRSRISGGPPPLLVLDGFEVAQHAPRHAEIWSLLNRFLAKLPAIRVIVSGRAPVSGIALGGRDVQNINLTGLERKDARKWLLDAGVSNEKVLDRVVEISRGVPLILWLTVRWLDEGGKVADLPEDLPKALVEGFLYERILDRVIDPSLKPLASDILVLRRLTQEMMPEVVDDRMPPDTEPADVFARLSREMALVGEGDASAIVGPQVIVEAGSPVLRLRPELRAATLRLLETAASRRVMVIDRRAVSWYARHQTPGDDVGAAELVYHRLRTNDVDGAEDAWTPGCAQYLVDAEAELGRQSAEARSWLRRKLEGGRVGSTSLLSWETDAVTRIRSLLGRGLITGVTKVLGERRDRSEGSPLTTYDAWTLWRRGDLEGARRPLRKAPADDSPASRDRIVLAALLAREAGDRREADLLLASIEEPGRWSDRWAPLLDALSVGAARARLCVDIPLELELYRSVRDDADSSRLLVDVLPVADVVLPLLARRVGIETSGLEAIGEHVTLPIEPQELERFAAEIDRIRLMHAPSGSPILPIVDVDGSATSRDPWQATEQGMAAILPTHGMIGDRAIAIRSNGLDLMILGWRRWRFATSSTFLARAVDETLTSAPMDLQRLSVIGTLGAFVGNEWGPVRFVHPGVGPLGALVARTTFEELSRLDIPPERSQIAAAANVLAQGMERTYDAVSLTSSATRQSSSTEPPMRAMLRAFLDAGPAVEGLGLYTLTPDPLDVLTRRVLGLPDTVPLRAPGPHSLVTAKDYPWFDPTAQRLFDVLVNTFVEIPEIKTIASSAGLRSYVHLDVAPRQAWRDLLEIAADQGLMADLLGALGTSFGTYPMVGQILDEILPSDVTHQAPTARPSRSGSGSLAST